MDYGSLVNQGMPSYWLAAKPEKYSVRPSEIHLSVVRTKTYDLLASVP